MIVGRDTAGYDVGAAGDTNGDGLGDLLMSAPYADTTATDAGVVKQGFFETEIHRVTRSFGNITHVFSTYEMRQKQDGPVIGRGVNSLQLYHDGARWWIASVTWDDEREGNPIPRELLP